MQAWCEVGRASTPASDTLGDVDGDDWLGSSTAVGTSDGTAPVPPLHTLTFRQGLHPVQEQSEDAASVSGQPNDTWLAFHDASPWLTVNLIQL